MFRRRRIPKDWIIEDYPDHKTKRGLFSVVILCVLMFLCLATLCAMAFTDVQADPLEATTTQLQISGSNTPHDATRSYKFADKQENELIELIILSVMYFGLIFVMQYAIKMEAKYALQEQNERPENSHE